MKYSYPIRQKSSLNPRKEQNLDIRIIKTILNFNVRLLEKQDNHALRENLRAHRG